MITLRHYAYWTHSTHFVFLCQYLTDSLKAVYMQHDILLISSAIIHDHLLHDDCMSLFVRSFTFPSSYFIETWWMSKRLFVVCCATFWAQLDFRITSRDTARQSCEIRHYQNVSRRRILRKQSRWIFIINLQTRHAAMLRWSSNTIYMFVEHLTNASVVVSVWVMVVMMT